MLKLQRNYYLKFFFSTILLIIFHSSIYIYRLKKFINRKYIKKCIELILYLLHYKISYQSYVKIESHIDYSIFYELS